MTSATLAAITLDPRGGGVARVSRLIWDVFRERWEDRCRLVVLVDEDRGRRSLETGTPARLAFGLRLAGAQLMGECEWVFFTHLSVARAQAFVPARLRRPYGVFLHGIEAWRPLSPAQRQTLQGARLLVANSQFTADRVAAAHPWIGPIAVCPLALRPSEARERPSTDSRTVAPLGKHAVLLVGRMVSTERYKGHDQLLEAWPDVVSRIPDAQLICAGDGDDAARLAAKAAALGIGDRVVFTGFVSEEALAALYRQAAVFAMPSRDEGFGLVYLEAMSHGLPCIGSIHDAAGEVIEDGVSGFLVDQADARSLAAHIECLLVDERRRRLMGERGRERWQHHFSYPQFRDRLLALIETSLGSRRPDLGSRVRLAG